VVLLYNIITISGITNYSYCFLRQRSKFVFGNLHCAGALSTPFNKLYLSLPAVIPPRLIASGSPDTLAALSFL